MARASYHYMVDLFYLEGGGPEGALKRSYRIVASSDSEAIQEAEAATAKVPSRTKLTFFRVRKVFRRREEVIHDSSTVPHA